MLFILAGRRIVWAGHPNCLLQKKWQTNRQDEKSEYYIKVIHTEDRFYFQAFQQNRISWLRETELKSWDPLIEHGKTTYFYKSGTLRRNRYLEDGELSDKWIFNTEQRLQYHRLLETNLKYVSDFKSQSGRNLYNCRSNAADGLWFRLEAIAR